ncbi:hypothetical protein SLS64_008078 [Diaporthe eres]
MDDPFLFDNQAFGISPREASSMDPQQRVMLTTVQRALENAGYVPDSTPSFAKETFGCFIGNATLDYVDNLRNDIDVYYSPGTLRAFLSGRISYAFRWSGPSMTLDTACSSSLVAIYQAARALAAGECRAAVAGGVNVITSPDMYLGLDRAHFLSPTGQCKAFDKAADGYCRSEGCAAVVLKRLDDAVNENDNILGVIKGIAVNQSGLASSITHPHAPTQEKLFKEVLSKTGMRHEDVSVVEAHGTGTPAGDPNEVRGIRNVFCKGRSREDPLHIMSIKANIGHCEAASGVASLTKLLLMLKHKRIPPQALLNELNPDIEDLAADGTVISTEPKDWTPPRGNRRTALLNNFGAAGSNAALLIQEYQHDASQQRPRLLDATTHVFGCSARNAELLQQLRESLVSYLTEHQGELSIADVCYTSTARRSLQSYRLSTTASSIKDLIANLKAAQILEAPDRPRATVSSRLSNGTPEKLSSLRKGKDPSQTLSEIFCAVYRDNVEIHWRAVFENSDLKPKMTDLPASPVHLKKYHSPVPRELAPGFHNVSANRPAGTRYTLLENCVGPNGDTTAEFHTPIQSLGDLIKGHVVCGKPLCPASVYAEMALAAITHADGADAEDQVFKLSDMSFTRPLLFSQDSPKTISITIHREERTDMSQIFRVSSFSDRGKLSEPKLHSFGKIKRQSLLKAAGKLKRTERALARRKASFERGGHQMFSTATMYKKIFSRVVEYSPQYWAVRKLYVDDDAEEALASCELPATSTHANYAGHPILLDTMLHIAGFMANLNVDADTVCICHHVASVSMLRKTFRSKHAFDVHCSNSSVPSAAESIFADVHAVDGDGIIAVMKGVEFKRSKLSKIQAGFEMIAEDFPKMNKKADQHIKLREQREIEEPRHVATKLAITVDDYEGSTATESLATSPASVVDILSKTTGVKAEALTPRTRLAALGVDSLMILELEKKLEDFLGHSPGVSELSMCESVGDVEALVSVASSAGGSRSPGAERRSLDATERKTSSSRSRTSSENEDGHDREEPQISNDMVKLLRSCLRPEEQPMARVQNGSKFPDSAPFYLIHPGAGMCFEYHRIGPLDRDVHAIQDPRIFSDAKEDWSCIEEMAQHYAAIVSKSRPSYPSRGIILGGYSFGGIVAFEMARLLSERGDCLVRGVVLIDAPPPLNHIPLARDTVQAAMAAKHVRPDKTRPPEAARFHEAIGALAVRNNLRRAALLGQYQPRREGPMPRVVLLRSSEGFRAAGHSLPENKWLHDRRDVKTSSEAWEQLMGAKVKVIDIPGDHFTPFEPGHIDGTSQAIYDACDMLDD